MSKKHPVVFVDLEFSVVKPLAVKRQGRSLKCYTPTRASLHRLARVIRRSKRGRTYPFGRGWLWEADEG